MVKSLFYICIFFIFQNISSSNVKEIDKNLLKEKYNNDLYLKFYKIPISLISFSTDAEKNYYYEIYKAFDNDYSTSWQASNYITQNLSKINIKITFSKTISLDRMIYQAPLYRGIKGYGYPTELKIFIKLRNINGTLSEKEEDFLLIDDIISEKTENILLFEFNEKITCDQIKLEWASLEDSNDEIKEYPSASEIILLFPENEYFNKLIDMFEPNDYTYLLIKPKYNNINLIDDLVDNIKEFYDISETIQEMVTRIKKIIDGEIKYEQKREFTTNQTSNSNIIYQHGDIEYYSQKILKMKRGCTNRQSTGIFGLSGEEIIIHVDANIEEANLPTIRFSQFIGISSNWLSSAFKLHKGKNILIFTNYNTKNYDIKVNPGGPIYIENKFTPEEQSQNIRIYIEGGILFPLFRLNDDEIEFKNTLSEYILKYNNNIDKYLNITEIESDKIMITITATDAYDNYVIKKKSPQQNLLHWEYALLYF